MTFEQYINGGGVFPAAILSMPDPSGSSLPVKDLFRARYDDRECFTDEPAKFSKRFQYYAEIFCPLYSERINAAETVLKDFIADETITTETGTRVYEENSHPAPSGTVDPSYSLGGITRQETPDITQKTTGGASGDAARLDAVSADIRPLWDEFFSVFEILFPEVW